jgi:ubiquitin carboxyl-terminal hydrolase 9/24
MSPSESLVENQLADNINVYFRITVRARNLLKLIPTDPSVQDDLDSLGTKPVALKAASPEENSPRLSPRNSPRKYFVSSSTSSSPSSSLQRQTPQKILKRLFDASQPGMSSFRVLYNLEVSLKSWQVV